MDIDFQINIQNKYYEYLYNNEIVFTFIDDCIVVLLKLINTQSDEDRLDIIDINNATYIGLNFKVLKIFNIWNPDINYNNKIIEYDEKSYLVFQENFSFFESKDSNSWGVKTILPVLILIIQC